MLARLGTLAAAALIAFGGLIALPASAQVTPDAASKKTVVLVHGAWADGGSWNRVIPYLLDAGFNVVAVQNPLSSLEGDVANTTRVIDDQPGDVILVGHSYGGVVITEAGNNPKVKALVYVAAFAPGPGQSINAILSAFPPPAWLSQLHADVGGYVTWPIGPWKSEFATGLPEAEQAVLHASQHPTFYGANDGAVGPVAAGLPAPSSRWWPSRTTSSLPRCRWPSPSRCTRPSFRWKPATSPCSSTRKRPQRPSSPRRTATDDDGRPRVGVMI